MLHRVWTMSGGSRSRREVLELVQRIVVFYLACFQTLVLVSLGLVNACSEDDDEQLSLVQIILKSEIVLYGKVLRTYPDYAYQRKGVDTVYTAEMQVFCIIKGPMTNRIINISEAGYIPGHCISANLLSDKNYVVIAAFDGHKYRPMDTEIAATPTHLANISTACRIEPKYPLGVYAKTARERCPIPAPSGDCIDESHFTTTTTALPSTEIDPYDNEDIDSIFVDPDPLEDPNETSDNASRPYSKTPNSVASSTTSSIVVSSCDDSLIIRFLPLFLVHSFLFELLHVTDLRSVNF